MELKKTQCWCSCSGLRNPPHPCSLKAGPSDEKAPPQHGDLGCALARRGLGTHGVLS